MRYVYLLRSLTFDRTYVGLTSNLTKRLQGHNEGDSDYTRPFRPWKLVVALRFEDNARAREFEKYLKTGSGQAFAKRHFW